MQVISDANVIFSAIISGKSLYKRLMTEFEVFSIDYVFVELAEHQPTILAKTKLDTNQLAPYVLAIFSNLKVLPSLILSKEAKQKALALCEGIDLKDAPYIALSIQMDIPLLTNDKILYEGLKKKKFKNIILFADFVQEFL
jgi:predicted nucleic acid-binding protein